MNLRVNKESIENVGLVIFDKDGTLIQLYNYWSRMVALRASLAQERFGLNDEKKNELIYALGVDVERKRLRSKGPVGLRKREIVIQAMIDFLRRCGLSVTYKTVDEIFKEADRISLHSLPELVKPIKGMHQLIEGLRKKGCKIGVATTDRTERAKLAMEFLGILDFVAFVVGEDMVSHGKPSPEMVEMILKQTRMKREETVIVGDAPTDILMGINAGLKASIGVCSGLTSRERLLEMTDYVVDDISKILVA
ncbi:HAD family hydrolase [bacterium]|nr:HAD family hydrolase [bacterium]